MIENSRRGVIGELAQAAGCDRTYFSQVLGGKAHFTADHALCLAEHLGLDESGQNYFLHLVLLNRASSARSKKIIQTKMEKIRRQALTVSQKIKSQTATEELNFKQQEIYYRTYLYAAVHILTSCEEFQTVSALSQRLHIGKEPLMRILRELLDMQLVRQEGLRFIHSGQQIHIPAGSALNSLNHMNFRNLAVTKSNESESLHYTTVFAVSRKDWPPLRTKLLAFIEAQRKSIHASGAEELYCFCCDLFSP